MITDYIISGTRPDRTGLDLTILMERDQIATLVRSMFAMSYLILSRTACSSSWLFSYTCFKFVLMNMLLFIGFLY
jgi:hypothetical protein